MIRSRTALGVEVSVAALVFLAALMRALPIAALPARFGAGAWGAGIALAALLYLASHVTRALRLGIIAVPMLGVSFRSAFMLHFFVAPWSLVLPFKLDELVRIAELDRIGRSLPRAVLVSLIDRSMDGVILVLFALFLMAEGRPQTAGLIGLVGVGLTAIAASFFLLPVLLEIVQRHLFLNNYREDAIRLLQAVDHVRTLLLDSRETIRSVVPFLVLSTLGIWGLELLATSALLDVAFGQAPSLLGGVETMLTRTDASWRLLLGGSAASVSPRAVLTVAFLIALLVPWVPLTIAYFRRSRPEPRRARIGQPLGAPRRRPGRAA